MNTIHFDLQRFAEGTLVNTTTGFNNSVTGAHQGFGGGYTMEPTLKAYYDTKLLDNARDDLVYAQFGKKQPLPAGNGRSVEWRKFNTFANATKLVEGVIPDAQKFGMTKLSGAIDQYGTYTAVSDVLQLHAYDPIIMGASEEMGASAAKTQETLTRDALLENKNVLYCDNITLATGAVASKPTSCAQMEASTTAMSMLTPDMVARAATIMAKNNVPKINGKYVAVVHPSVAYDLRKSEGWMEAHKYASPEEIFNGEIGELHNVRFVMSNNAPVLGGPTYQNKATTQTYATYFFGKDSFGIIDPAGGGMQMIVKDKSQVGGPLDQFSTIGYKLETNGATILYPERLLRVMSCSAFSADDEINQVTE